MGSHDLARRLRIIWPVGNAKERKPILPAPDPPTRGWWIDPEDPACMRLHNGRTWSHRSIRLRPERLHSPAAPAGPYDWRKSTGWWLLSLWLRALIGSFLTFWVAPSLDRAGDGYDWSNRLGLVLLWSAALQIMLGAGYGAFFMRDELAPTNRGFISWVPLLIVPFEVVMAIVLWDRIADALWLS